jgi:hypothetical protein
MVTGCVLPTVTGGPTTLRRCGGVRSGCWGAVYFLMRGNVFIHSNLCDASLFLPHASLTTLGCKKKRLRGGFFIYIKLKTQRMVLALVDRYYYVIGEFKQHCISLGSAM